MELNFNQVRFRFYFKFSRVPTCTHHVLICLLFSKIPGEHFCCGFGELAHAQFMRAREMRECKTTFQAN